MTCEEYIRRLTERAASAGYASVDRVAPAAAREYGMLGFMCFARRVGQSLHIFGVRAGDGLVLEQLRTLSDQFYNAGLQALREATGLVHLQLACVLAYEKSPPPQDVDYYLSRARPRWPFGGTRSTPMVVDLSTIKVHRPWFPAKAVGAPFLEECARG